MRQGRRQLYWFSSGAVVRAFSSLKRQARQKSIEDNQTQVFAPGSQPSQQDPSALRHVGKASIRQSKSTDQNQNKEDPKQASTIILGVPYYAYSIMGPQNPILIIKAPELHSLHILKVFGLNTLF